MGTISRYRIIVVVSIIAVAILIMLGYQMYESFQELGSKYMKLEAEDLQKSILQRQKEEGYSFAMGWAWWDEMKKAVAENDVAFISNEVKSITSSLYWSSIVVIHDKKVIYHHGPLIPPNPVAFLKVAQDIPQKVHNIRIGKRIVGVMSFLICNNDGEDPLPDSAILLLFDWKNLLKTHFTLSSFVGIYISLKKPKGTLAYYPLLDIKGKPVGYLTITPNRKLLSEMHTKVYTLLWLEILVLVLLLVSILIYVKRHTEISRTLLRAIGVKERFASLKAVARHVAETVFTNTIYRKALETALNTKSVEKTLFAIAHTVAKTLQSDQWVMILISGEKQEWKVLLHSDTIKEEDLKKMLNIIKEQPITTFDILKERKACLFLEDVNAFPQWRKADIKGIKEIASSILIPMKVDEEVVAALCLDWFNRKSFTQQIRKLTLQIEEIIDNILTSTYDIRDMFWLSYKDPLLGIHNRRIISKLAERKLHGSILFMDIDDFRLINDRYGHATGDMVLKQVAEIISRMMRKEDVLFRYGGDEFVAYLENIDIASAREIAKRVRNAVREGLKEYTIDLSIGISETMEGSDIIEIIKQADMLMYQEKRKKKERTGHEDRNNHRG